MSSDEKVKKLTLSISGYKSHFTTAEKRLNKLVTEASKNTSAKTIYTYADLKKAVENLEARYKRLNDALEELCDLAGWAEASSELTAHQTCTESIAERYATAATAAYTYMGSFAQAVRNQVEGTATGDASSALDEANTDKSLPKPNISLTPEILRHDADLTAFEIWVDKFGAWYSSSRFSKATRLEQQSYLFSVLDNNLCSILRAAATDKTPVYGSAGAPGYIELLKAEFEHLNPVFARRVAFFESTQKMGQSFIEFAANVKSNAQNAKMREISQEELIVHVLLKGAEPELRVKLLKLTNPSYENLVEEARAFYAAQASEAILSKPSQVSNVNQTVQQNSAPRVEYIIQPVVTKQELNAKGITCYKCGSKKHMTFKCEVHPKNLNCTNCQNTGHIRQICLGKRKQTRGRRDFRPRSRERSKSAGRTPAFSPGPGRRNPQTFNAIEVVDVEEKVHINAVEDISPNRKTPNSSTRKNTCKNEQQSNCSSDRQIAAPIANEICAVFPQEKENLTNMPVLVSTENSHINATANPDTGAPYTIFNVEYCEQLGAKINADLGPTKLQSCTDGKIELLGYVDVTIRFQGHAVKTSCLVSQNMPGKFLIGRPDLRKLHVIGQNFPFKENLDCRACETISQCNAVSRGTANDESQIPQN